MHRKALGLAAAALIVAAIGFSFIGVAAAGNGRGPNPTRTPAPPTIQAGTPSSIQLTPNPLQIACDGVEASTLTVRVTDASGKPVPNGTLVMFSADYGVADPPQAETRKGDAQTRIVLSPQAATSFSGAFATVRVGDIEAAIRIHCEAPGGCPTSPPTHPMSPPCNPDPGPCPFSPPPSHPMSPPCTGIEDCLDFTGGTTCHPPTPCVATSPPCPTSTPNDPDPCSDTGAPFSPPCGTPTPTPQFPAHFEIDCNLLIGGIQSDCDYSVNATEIEVGIVLVSDDEFDISLASFQFDLVNSRKDLLFPPAIAGTSLNGNPDFNNALSASGAAWNCDFIPPTNDVGSGAPGTTVSRIGCFISSSTPPAPILLGYGSLMLGTVTYVPPDTASVGQIELGLTNALTANLDGIEFTGCPFPPGFCATATIALVDTTPSPTPTPFVSSDVIAHFAIDCDLSTAGVQADCAYPIGAGAINVGIVVVNDSPDDRPLVAFQFDLVNPRRDLLFPPARTGTFTNANPDFNDALQVPGIPLWNCELLPPVNDTGTGPIGTTVSRLTCYIPTRTSVPVLPGNGVLLLGTVSFDVSANASPADIELALTNAVVGDDVGNEFAGSCSPLTPCATANISLRNGLVPFEINPTSTPVPTVTPTPTPPARRRR